MQQEWEAAVEAIRAAIKRNNLTYVWLINRLRERGCVTDKTELSSALAGTRKGPKVDNMLMKSALILDEYESKFAAPKAP